MPDSVLTATTLGLIACPADAAVADQITASLVDKGLRVVAATAQSGGGQAVVVLISAAALHDPDWTAAVERHSRERLVPVQVGPVVTGNAPTALQPFNWIIWQNDLYERLNARIFIATQTDLQRHRITRSVDSMSQIWQRGGRRDDDLILDVGEARSAADAVHRQFAVDSAATPRPLVEFVDQSVKRSRRRRWLRRFRWARRAGLAFVVAAVVIVAVVSARQLATNNKLEYSVGNLQEANRPDLQAIKLSGELIDGLSSNTAHPVAFRQLTEKLAQPWTSAVIGIDNDSAINDIALTSDATTVVTVDGLGTVSWWDTGTGNITARYGFGVGPLYSIDATDDGSMVAVANDHDVIVIDRSGHRLATIASPTSESAVAITGDGRHVVVLTADGHLQTAAVSRGASNVTVPTKGVVLAMRRIANGRVLALVANGTQLTLIDAVTGASLAATTWPRPVYPYGAIGRDGSVLINGADGELWWAKSGLQLVPTGARVPDIITAAAIANDDVVLVSSDPTGTLLFDPTDRLSLGPACTEYSHVLSIRTSPDGQVASCNGRDTVDLGSLAGRAPTALVSASTSPTAAPVTASSPTGPIALITASADGIVTIDTRPTGTIRLDPAAIGYAGTGPANTAVLYGPGQLHYSGVATAVAIRMGGNTLAVGSSDGSVTEIDLQSATSFSMVGRWQLPDGASVRKLSWDGAAHLVASTDAYRWTEPSCAGCYVDVLNAFTAVADRRWPCYAKATVDVVAAPVRKLLNLKVCAPSPQPIGR